MRVIEFGYNWCVRVRCTGNNNGGQGCNALLEVEREDMRYFEGSTLVIYRPEAVCIRCPECGCITDLDNANWPKNYHKLNKTTSAWLENKDDLEI